MNAGKEDECSVESKTNNTYQLVFHTIPMIFQSNKYKEFGVLIKSNKKIISTNIIGTPVPHLENTMTKIYIVDSIERKEHLPE
jgi:hypothetical protein